jgi:hypothetical protein
VPPQRMPGKRIDSHLRLFPHGHVTEE